MQKTRLMVTLAGMIMLGSLEYVSATNELMLFDFEDQGAVVGQRVIGWTRVWGNAMMAFNYSDQHVTNGQYSAYLENPVYIPGDPAYSQYEYSTAGYTYYSPMDFSGYSFLTMDIYCPDTEDNALRVVLVDNQSRYTGASGYFIIPPQRQMVLKIPMQRLLNAGANALDPSNIVQIGFCRTSTERPHKLYIDNIKLVNLDPVQRQYVFDSVTGAFQFGATNQTTLKTGFALVEPCALYTEVRGYGWQSAAQLTVETSAVSDDKVDPIVSSYISGQTGMNFIVKTQPGSYEVVVFSPYYADYGISINGGAEERIRSLNFYDCRKLYATTTATNNLLTVSFNPADNWAVMALVVYPVNNNNDLDRNLTAMLVEDAQCAPWATRQFMSEEADIEAGNQPPTPNATETERGYQVYVKPTTANLRYYGIPSESELIRQDIVMNVCKNEWESKTLCLFSLEKLDVSARLSSFTNSNNTLSPDNLELKVAMPYYTPYAEGYVKLPRLLLPSDRIVHVETNQSQPFWLMVKNTQPGTYTGNIIVTQHDQGEERTIPVTINCLDADLDQLSDLNLGIYYYQDHPEDFQNCFNDMKKHGINYLTMPAMVTFARDSGGNITYGNESGMNSLFGIYTNYLSGPVCFNYVVVRTILQALVGQPLTSQAYLGAQSNMIATLLGWGATNNWPEMWYYDFDEMGWNADASVLYPAAKNAGMRTYSTSCGPWGVGTNVSIDDGIDNYVYFNGASDPIGQKEDIKSADSQKKMHFYTFSNSRFPLRWMWGLYNWAGGYEGIQMWHYFDGGNLTSDYLSGSCIYFLGYGLSGANSLSSPDWENVSMGLTDYKVIRTLQRLIENAKAGPDGSRKELALQYEQRLSDIKNFVITNYDCNPDVVGPWLDTQADNVRAELLSDITDLRAPIVSIASPLPNASFTAPATIAIAADASDPDGTVTKVEFYNNGMLLGADTSSAGGWTYTWNNVEASGTNGLSLTAKATDSYNAVGISSAEHYTVNDTALKCYWKFDENSGSSAGDSSGNGNGGTIADATWHGGADAKVINALLFSGTRSYVQKNNAGGLPAADADQTECFWYYVSSNPTTKNSALSITGAGNGMRIGFINSGGMQFGVWRYDGTLIVATGTLPAAGAWHHVAYVQNGQNKYLYIDGSQTATSTSSADSGTQNTVDAGRTPGVGDYWSGKLDEIRIYSRALTSAEIQALYNSGAPRQ